MSRVTICSLGGTLASKLRGGRGWVFSAAHTTSKKTLSAIFQALRDLRDNNHQQSQQQQKQETVSSAPGAVICKEHSALGLDFSASPSYNHHQQQQPCARSVSADASLASNATRASRSNWLHLTGTHVPSQAGRLYRFRGALDTLTASEMASFDTEFARTMTSQTLPLYAPSVSTVLATMVSNDGLRFWRQKVGEEEANRVSSIAISRGTVMHSAIEQFLTRRVVDSEVRDLVASGEGEENELMLSMSSVINSIAMKDSRYGHVYAAAFKRQH